MHLKHKLTMFQSYLKLRTPNQIKKILTKAYKTIGSEASIKIKRITGHLNFSMNFLTQILSYFKVIA